MRSVCTAPVPLPLRIPVSVEEPVPPTFTESVEVAPRVLAEVKYGIWPTVPLKSEEVAIEIEFPAPSSTSEPDRPRPRVTDEVATL